MEFNGTKLRDLRTDRHATLKQLADHAGCTISYISSIEKGRIKSPNITILTKLAEYFQISTDEFVVSAKEMPKEPALDMQALRDLRKMKHLSLEKAAKLSGLHPTTLSKLENGHRRTAELGTLTALAGVYNVDVADLMLQREAYVDLSALVRQSDTVIIDGREISVKDKATKERVLTALRIAAAWASEESP